MTTAVHCDRRGEIAAFLLGALTAAEERDAMVHVSGCGDCQVTLAELMVAPDLLGRVPRSMAALIDRGRPGPAAPHPGPAG